MRRLNIFTAIAILLVMQSGIAGIFGSSPSWRPFKFKDPSVPMTDFAQWMIDKNSVKSEGDVVDFWVKWDLPSPLPVDKNNDIWPRCAGKTATAGMMTIRINCKDMSSQLDESEAMVCGDTIETRRMPINSKWVKIKPIPPGSSLEREYGDLFKYCSMTQRLLPF